MEKKETRTHIIAAFILRPSVRPSCRSFLLPSHAHAHAHAYTHAHPSTPYTRTNRSIIDCDSAEVKKREACLIRGLLLLMLLLLSSKSFTLFFCAFFLFRQPVLEEPRRRSKAGLGVDVRWGEELGSVAEVERAGVSRVKNGGLTLFKEESCL